MLYSGIDLHRDNAMITTVNDTGKIMAQQKLANADFTILEYFSVLPGPHRAVVEATANWFWLSDLLFGNGIELILAHAKYLKAISYAKVKTDKVDSLTLANLLRIDMIPRSFQIRPERRPLRDLMRTRLRLVQKQTSCHNSIHRLLGKYNLKSPEQAENDSMLEHQLKWFEEQLTLLRRQISELEHLLHPHLIPDQQIQRLLWVPGIGRIIAFTLLLEIDTIDRFPSVGQFFSYCRLVPGANNSNRSLRHKSADKNGNRYLKMVFMEAAVRAIQYYPEIKQYFQSKSRKKHTVIARTLVAQELARICYHILSEGCDYDHRFKGRELSRRKKPLWPRLASPGT